MHAHPGGVQGVDRTLTEFIEVEGFVEHGDARGRELGFPTANLPASATIERDGVYAGIIRIGSKRFITAVSVGYRPTFHADSDGRLLEAHVLGFTGDLYGTHVLVELHTRLRPQRAYLDVSELVRQIHLDVDATKAWARSNGLESLLPNESEPDFTSSGQKHRENKRGRHRDDVVVRRKKLKPEERIRERRERQNERINQALREANRDAVTHEWIAEKTGLPVGYVRWYLPDLKKAV